MYYRNRKGRLGTPPPPTAQQFTIPSSTGGINALDNLMQMPPVDCLYCHNLMPSEYGLRLREGYKEWATNVPGGAVKTMIAFEGQNADASADRLFAVTSSGIYNVSVFGTTAPVEALAFTDNTPEAGYGVSTEFTNDANERFLYYADSRNGLFAYEESTDLWTPATFTGPDFDITDVAFVMSWKNRLWFIQENSGDAFYTEVNAVAGTVTKFTFGSKFTHGGELKCLYSWTIDGGAGLDDLLIAVSRGGDVLVYQGVDPALAPDQEGGFTLVGSYFIGELPESRRIGAAHGGELYLLSTYGIVSVRDLLQGVPAEDKVRSPSAKISRYLRRAVQAQKDSRVWELVIYPADGFLQIVTPYQEAKDAIQWNQNLLTKAWGMWRGVPVNCAATWNAGYYVGDLDGKVYVYDGALDGATLPGSEIATDTVNSFGDGWTSPAAGDYSCDGTQTGQSSVVAQLSAPLEFGETYTYRYTVTNYVSGSHSVQVGPGALSPARMGDGVFTGNVVSQSSVGVYELIASEDFVGDITEVSINVAGKVGSPVEFDILTSFQPPGGDISSYKRVGFIRSIGVLSGIVNVNVDAVYDYNVEKIIQPPPAVAPEGTNLWNLGIWNEDLWDYATQGISFPSGAAGLGRVVAVGMRGSSNTRLTIVGWDISYTVGGFL